MDVDLNVVQQSAQSCYLKKVYMSDSFIRRTCFSCYDVKNKIDLHMCMRTIKI